MFDQHHPTRASRAARWLARILAAGACTGSLLAAGTAHAADDPPLRTDLEVSYGAQCPDSGSAVYTANFFVTQGAMDIITMWQVQNQATGGALTDAQSSQTVDPSGSVWTSKAPDVAVRLMVLDQVGRTLHVGPWLVSTGVCGRAAVPHLETTYAITCAAGSPQVTATVMNTGDLWRVAVVQLTWNTGVDDIVSESVALAPYSGVHEFVMPVERGVTYDARVLFQAEIWSEATVAVPADACLAAPDTTDDGSGDQTGSGGGVTSTAPGTASASSGATLPVTGSDRGPAAVTAAALVAGGLVLVHIARVRRPAR